MEWVNIEDYHYEINKIGEVRNTNTKKILKQSLDGKGNYYQVTLTYKINLKTIQRPKLVHRLVCKAFNENTENKPCVNHKNGIKTDNRLENLEWCTYSENVNHAIRMGLVDIYKNKYYKGKFGSEHNRSIKVECDGIIYGSMSEACRIHNMNITTISKAITLNRTAKGMLFKIVK